VIEMLRSPGLPAVTANPPVSDSHHDASADIRAALLATASALNFMSQNGSAKTPRKLKLTPFKTADEKNTIGDIMYQWESEFEAAEQGISVAVIVNEGMTAGYPLYIWVMGHRSSSMDSEGQLQINSQDPEDIMNWGAARFKHELHSSHFYVPPNFTSIMKRFESVSCPEPGNAHHYGAFSIALQEIKIYGLGDRYGEKSLAQRFYNVLPALLKHFMALYDSLHEHTPDIRDDYHALQKEVRNVKQWRPFTDALAQLSKAKAFSAATPKKHTLPPPSNEGRGPSIAELILAAGDTMQFATGGEDPKAEAWVQSNAPKFDVKYRKVRQGTFFIIGGKPDAITRFLNAGKQVRIVATKLPERTRDKKRPSPASGAHANVAKQDVSHVLAMQ